MPAEGPVARVEWPAAGAPVALGAALQPVVAPAPALQPEAPVVLPGAVMAPVPAPAVPACVALPSPDPGPWFMPAAPAPRFMPAPVLASHLLVR
jgi:hypothetical protein